MKEEKKVKKKGRRKLENKRGEREKARKKG